MIISKGSGLNDSMYGKTYYPIKKYIAHKEQLHEGRSMIGQLFSMESSKNFAEQYTDETDIGDFVPGREASRYPDTDFQEGYSKVIYAYTWKNRFAITQEMIEDVKMGKIKKRASKFMSSYSRTKEKFAAAVYSGGVGTSLTFGGETFDIKCADGLALWSTAHTSKTGEADDQTNVYNSSFSYDNIGILAALASDFRNDNGERQNVNMDTIVVPYTTAADALQLQSIFEVLNGDGKPDSTDRAGNYQAGRWNVKVWPFLTAPSGLTSGYSWFFLIDSEYLEDYSAMVWQNRVELSMTSYVDQNNDNNIWKARARFGAAPTDWRYTIACIPGVGTTWPV